MAESSSTYIILLVINALLYLICFYLIAKRRRYTCITVRSPVLLMFNIIGGFFTTTIILIGLQVKNNENFSYYVPSAFFIFQSLMMLSFLLRCHRVITCCKISDDEQNNLEKFAENKLLYLEKFYMRILVISMFVILIAVVVVDIIAKYTFTINLLISKKNFIVSQANIWLVANFLEQFAMITYGYLMLVNEVKHKIKFELFGILICWFIYSNAMTFFDYYDFILEKSITTSNDTTIILSITLAAFYVSLFLNGFFPIILSFSYKTSVAYHFEPKLTSNLYLFLANEHCYGTFNDFLRDSNQKNDVFYLKLYTSIMKYKLMYIAHEPEGEIVDEGRKINEGYFSSSKTYEEGFMKIVQNISQSNAIKNDTFDEALKYSYDYLSNKFIDFKRTPDYKVLIDKLSLNSYIQCKMNNVGLVNKF